MPQVAFVAQRQIVGNGYWAQFLQRQWLFLQNVLCPSSKKLLRNFVKLVLCGAPPSVHVLDLLFLVLYLHKEAKDEDWPWYCLPNPCRFERDLSHSSGLFPSPLKLENTRTASGGLLPSPLDPDSAHQKCRDLSLGPLHLEKEYLELHRGLDLPW